MKRLLILVVAPLVVVLTLVWVAWGPLLVTSPEEALAKAQGHRTASGQTYADMVSLHEEATGKQGEWRVVRNGSYDSLFEGDRGGFLWIVTWGPPQADSELDFGLEIWVKNLTGLVSGPHGSLQN